MSNGSDTDFSFSEKSTKIIGVILIISLLGVIIYLNFGGDFSKTEEEKIYDRCVKVGAKSSCVEIQRCINNIDNFNNLFYEIKDCKLQNVTVYPKVNKTFGIKIEEGVR